MNAAVTRTPLGFSVALGRPRRWEHPWTTRLHWIGDQWVATVRPGFVNGRAPVVRTTAGAALALAAKGTFYQGLIDARSGAADIRRAAELATEDGEELKALGPNTRLDVALYNNPPLQLAFRAVGFGSLGGAGSAVPQFFKDKGVQDAQRTDSTDGLEAAARAAGAGPKKGSRLLRAADVVLHQPRLALTSTITQEPGIVTGISNVTQTLSLRSAAAGDRLKVFATPLWDDQYAATAGIDPLSGDYEEPAFDELRIATVYLLSPPDAEPGSEPDQTWQPWVRHALFWNLNFLQKTQLQVPDQDNAFGKLLSVATLLGGGAAAFAINFVSASLNDMNQNALNLLAAHSMAGAWWTATGGGSTSALPPEPEPEPQGATGYDKAGRLQAKRTAVARALKAARLDPPFPFHALALDAALLNS